MGSVGDCFDNAVMESFWSRMQVELLDRKRWITRLELGNAIFEYLLHRSQDTPKPPSNPGRFSLSSPVGVHKENGFVRTVNQQPFAL
jgi:transposase InsO family protein